MREDQNEERETDVDQRLRNGHRLREAAANSRRYAKAELDRDGYGRSVTGHGHARECQEDVALLHYGKGIKTRVLQSQTADEHLGRRRRRRRRRLGRRRAVAATSIQQCRQQDGGGDGFGGHQGCTMRTAKLTSPPSLPVS